MKLQAKLVMGSLLAGCSSTYDMPPPAPNTGYFEPFTPQRSAYMLGPGDELDIVMHAVPELSRGVKIGPDGRIAMPLVPPIMVAGLSIAQAQQVIMQHMSTALVDARLDLAVTNYAPQQVFVGGEVQGPGVFDLPGQISPLQAIIMAGGFNNRANMKQVIIIRRDPGGVIESYSFDVKAGIYNAELARFGPLQRYDVIYVPKSRIAQQNLLLQQYFYDALPINFNLYYDLGNSSNVR